MIELHKKFYQEGYDSRNSLGDILSSIEVNLATIVCCGPALRPLFRKMFPRLFSGRSTNETGKYNTPSRYGNCASGGGLFHLKDMHRSRTQTEIRGYSPNGSEEEIMTYNGILRTTAVSRDMLQRLPFIFCPTVTRLTFNMTKSSQQIETRSRDRKREG